MEGQKIRIPIGKIIVDLIDESGNTIQSIHSSGEKIFDLINKGIESLYEKNGCGSIRVASPAEPAQSESLMEDRATQVLFACSLSPEGVLTELDHSKPMKDWGIRRNFHNHKISNKDH